MTLASWFYGPQPESFCIPLPMANMVFIATNWPSSMTHAVPLWLAGLFYLFATQEGKRYRPIGWMFIIPFVLFVIGRGRGYYMAAGYPMLLAAGGMGRAVGCFVEFAARTRNPNDYLDSFCNWGPRGCRDCPANCTAWIIGVAIS